MLILTLFLIWLVGVPVATYLGLRLRLLLARRRRHGPRTLWPGSNDSRWPPPEREYVETGLVRAEEWANYG